MVAKKEIAPELLAEARRLYEQTLAPVGDIAKMVGLSRSNFYERVSGGGWRSRRARPTFSMARAVLEATQTPDARQAAQELLADATVRDDPVSLQQRAAIAQRIIGVVEREMDAIERILKVITPADQLEAEHSARTLASLSRTLREIAALNQPDNEMPPNGPDDDDPRGIDEFRRELTRRLQGIIDTRRARISGRFDGFVGEPEPG
jgi:hypothetical protein